MSKNRTENTNPRSAVEIEIEIAKVLADRKEMNRALKALRAEHRAAVAAEERARAEAIGARMLAAAGDPEVLAAIAAEVAETAETADSGAAPPAPEDADDQQHEHREWGGDRGVDL